MRMLHREKNINLKLRRALSARKFKGVFVCKILLCRKITQHGARHEDWVFLMKTCVGSLTSPPQKSIAFQLSFLSLQNMLLKSVEGLVSVLRVAPPGQGSWANESWVFCYVADVIRWFHEFGARSRFYHIPIIPCYKDNHVTKETYLNNTHITRISPFPTPKEKREKKEKKCCSFFALCCLPLHWTFSVSDTFT